MIALILGLLLFFVPHTSQFIARTWWQQKRDSWGEAKYAIAYSLVSLLGLILIVWGYGQSRINPIFVWNPPTGLYHLTSVLVLIALVLLVATYIPNNHIKARVGHPMLLGIKVWALAHLFSNGRLGDLILFGAFLAWSIVFFITLRRRDRANGIKPAPAKVASTAMVVVFGSALWFVIAMWLHLSLIGVAPFGSR